MRNIIDKDKFNKIIKKLKNLSKYDKLTYVWIGFFIFGIILVINIIVMMFFLIDSNYEYKILNKAYIDVVLPGQVTDQTLSLGIVRIEELNIEDLKIGDQIVIKNDYGLDVYWVETVVSVNLNTNVIQATYNQEYINDFDNDEVLGVYVKEANFMGTVYYSSSFLEGFIFLTISHGIVLYTYYHILLSKKEDFEIVK